MAYNLVLVQSAQDTIDDLQITNAAKHKKVLKTLGLLQANSRHPSLNTHEYLSLKGPNGEKVFEAYVENKTPSAYRLFFFYGSASKTITILAVTPHP